MTSTVDEAPHCERVEVASQRGQGKKETSESWAVRDEVGVGESTRMRWGGECVVE